jgi:hypothetical protein
MPSHPKRFSNEAEERYSYEEYGYLYKHSTGQASTSTRREKMERSSRILFLRRAPSQNTPHPYVQLPIRADSSCTLQYFTPLNDHHTTQRFVTYGTTFILPPT